jgi:uncharacterized protein
MSRTCQSPERQPAVGRSPRLFGLAITLAVSLLVDLLLVTNPRPGWAQSVPQDAAASVASVSRSHKRILRLRTPTQTTLGVMYANGRGVPQNVVVAATWYARAARRGDPTAQYLLGLMYDKGQGVPQDDVLAQMWLNLAAARAAPRERAYYVRIRDAVATKMSEGHLATAQWLAYRWRPLQ